MLENLSGSEWGILGGIVGSILGILGGAIGTYYSIRNTHGPLERRFMIRASAAAWIAMSIFIVVLLLLPSPYRFFMWVSYGILLPLGINYVNKRQQAIRAMESPSD